MQKVIYIILGLISAIVIGVSFIPPEEKPFDDYSYFVPVVGDADYRSLYASYIDQSISFDSKLCILQPITAGANGKWTAMNLANLLEKSNKQKNHQTGMWWFWAFEQSKIFQDAGDALENINENGVSLMSIATKNNPTTGSDGRSLPQCEYDVIFPVENIETSEFEWRRMSTHPDFEGSSYGDDVQQADHYFKYSDISDFFMAYRGQNVQSLAGKREKAPYHTTPMDFVYYEVPYGTPVLAPADFYLVNYNSDKNAPYPTNGTSHGIHAIGYIIDGVRGYAFKVEFSSLDRLFCCAGVDEATPEEHSGHAHSTTSVDVYRIAAGQVIGYAGLSGVPMGKTDILTRKEFGEEAGDEYTSAVIGVSIERTPLRTGTGAYDESLASELRAGRSISAEWTNSSIDELYASTAYWDVKPESSSSPSLEPSPAPTTGP